MEQFHDQPKGEDYEDRRRKCDSCDSRKNVKWNHYQFSCEECKKKIVWTFD